jgi:hypothetical protein
MPVIKIRRGTTQQWAASNRVLQLGELGLDTTLNKLKAGNGSTAWSSLAFLQADADVTELAQDAVATALANGTHSNITVTYSDNGNSISLATGPDVITQTSLSNTLTNATTGYVPIADVGSADGVASLDANGKVPDSEIPTAIARLASPTFTGTPAAPTATAGTNTTQVATTAFVGTAVSNLVNAAPESLNTLKELSDALGADANYASTITTALGTKAPIASPTFTGTVTIPSGASISGYAPLASPTFTGTVSGVTKSMVGLANVDNTTDANKPVSTATQTALDLKLDSSTAASTYLTQALASTGYVAVAQPSIDYYITNSGSGAYTVNGVDNGPVEFIKGKKYRVHIAATGHPFWIQTVSGAYSSGNVYSTGITGNGTQSGHIIVELPQNAPDNLYYACQYHSSMAGSVLVRTDNISFNPQASNYTLTTSDSGRLVEMSGGGTLTITDSSSFPVGFTCDILQTTTSQVTIAGTSFTPDATPGLKLRTRWSSATLIKRALNSWVVLGDLSA